MLVALALVSAALLAYQIVLLHLLAVRHWSHFAALVISLALLGFGASGSALALARRRLRGREPAAFAAAAALAALAYDPAYRLSTAIPFDAFELLAVPRQMLHLSLTYLVLSVPFFLGATAIALGFELRRSGVARVYAANLVGSGAGAAAGLALLSLLPVERLPAAVGLLGACALVPLARAGILLPAAVALLAVMLPPPALPMSSYKEESVARSLPGARVLQRRDGPLGRLDLVAAPTLRYLPGASLTLSEPVPPRPVLYRNGQPIGSRAVPADADLLDLTTAAAAFALPPGPDAAASVLVVGLGGGGEVLHARSRGAGPIAVVDPDDRIDPLLAPGARVPAEQRVVEDPRAFLHAGGRRFARVLVTGIGSLGSASAGMAAAGEDYLFTREGIADLWRALEPRGVLAITRWVLEPPRDVLRLLATVRVVLDAEGLSAAEHVALVRGWGTATLLVSRAPLDAEAVAALRAWCEARWFDLAWAPGVGADEANRFNVLEPDRFRIGAERILGPAPGRFLESYPFHIEPVTDDAPFFHHFLPLSRLGRLWREEGRLGLPYFEWGLVAQALALVQAVPLAAALILLPLAALRVEPGRPAGGWLLLYFGLLGLAYMLLEITFIHRLVLFLSEPVYSATVVLTAFLLFAGMGSALAPRLSGGRSWAPFAGIALLAPAAYLAAGALWAHAAAAPLPARMLLAVGLLAPLATAMGMPFPLGLQRVADRRPGWLPWCWGVNGYFSVIGAAAAPLLALGLGFRGVILLAGLLYLSAGLALHRTVKPVG
ncbi:MAG: hypothetical protein ABR599_07760 [Gemmatimonadota bacterium]